jgi:ubiquinol-cytochrome c reductase cytochrome c1 subunit
MVKVAHVLLTLLCAPALLAVHAAEPAAATPAAGAPAASAAAAGESSPVDWERWHAANDVSDLASLQRGARNFMNYCNGCHSLKYMRYQRMADDLKIPPEALNASLIAPGSTNLDYITTAMPAADALNWFGKVPPDLSLLARSKGVDYIYRLLKTFYVDPKQATGTNNLAYPNTAMPAVLSSLQGVQAVVFRDAGKDAAAEAQKPVDHFQLVAPGQLSAADYDAFVRDTVNFLDYAGEPAQIDRHAEGIWVVLFMVLLTLFVWLLKNEYWKDVR